jgi:hypothetical protein
MVLQQSLNNKSTINYLLTVINLIKDKMIITNNMLDTFLKAYLERIYFVREFV